MKVQVKARECSATAALYSLGALSPEESQKFEQRLASGCPLCTAELAEYANVVDHLALGVPEVEPPPLLRQRVVDRIGAASERSSSPKQEGLKEMKIVRGGDSPWIQLPAPGVQIRQLLGRKTLLVRMQPGSVFPEHEHHQAEQCYVLEGSVTDSDGVTADAGDFVCMPAGITHQPIHTDTGCLFLITYS